MCFRLSILSTPPLLLCCLGVGLSQQLMFLRVSVRTSSLRVGGMLCLPGGRLFVTRALRAPALLEPWVQRIPPDLHGFYKWIFDSLDLLDEFVRQVVTSRRHSGLRSWATWLREDLGSRPYALGHGPVHLLLISAVEMGFAWDGEQQVWNRAALSPLRMMTRLLSIFKAPLARPGSIKLVLSWRTVKGVGVPSFWTSRSVQCRFCGGRDGDGHLFLGLHFSPIHHVREIPEFMPLMVRHRSKWPCCLLCLASWSEHCW